MADLAVTDAWVKYRWKNLKERSMTWHPTYVDISKPEFSQEERTAILKDLCSKEVLDCITTSATAGEAKLKLAVLGNVRDQYGPIVVDKLIDQMFEELEFDDVEEHRVAKD